MPPVPTTTPGAPAGGSIPGVEPLAKKGDLPVPDMNYALRQGWDEMLHPRDPTSGRWVIRTDGRFSTVDVQGMTTDEAARRLLEARSTGKRAEAFVLDHAGGGPYHPPRPDEQKRLIDRAAEIHRKRKVRGRA